MLIDALLWVGLSRQHPGYVLIWDRQHELWVAQKGLQQDRGEGWHGRGAPVL